MALRGNWDYTGLNNAFEYLLLVTTSVNIGGREFYGWSDPHNGAIPPKICFQNSSNNVIINNFIQKLFHYGDFMKSRQLEQLFQSCLESFIMNLKYFKLQYGSLILL